MFTITKNTLTGKQEVLTNKGFKTREWLEDNEAEVSYFDKKEGSEKVIEFRKNCRNSTIRRSN